MGIAMGAEEVQKETKKGVEQSVGELPVFVNVVQKDVCNYK